MKRQEALRWIERYCMQLRAMGLRLLLVADVPNYNYGVYDVRARGEIIRPRDPSVVQESREQPESVYDRRNAAINEQLQSICARTGATFVPLHNVFKRETRYVTVDNRESGEDILYRDPDHLSASGSLLAARFLHPYISTESSTSLTGDAVPPDPPKL
jgi:lysophospholipase L1-like esterase